jgi:hypothetical protein
VRLMLVVSLLMAAVPGLGQTDGNLLPNGDLEAARDGKPEGWTVDGRAGAEAAWEAGAGMEASGCVGITVTEPGPDDVCLRQDLKLEPHSAYVLKGFIKGRDIRSTDAEEKPVGPSLATSLWKCDSVRAKDVDPPLGTFDWRPFALDFATGPDGRITVEFRFGRDHMLGQAWFDRLSVEPNPETERFEGKHFVLNLYRDQVELATREGVEQAVRNTDLAYEAYAELTGRDPIEGKLSAWAPRLWDIEALGWSGNPVLWVPIEDVLRDNWRREGFCPEVFLHELAHDFDYGPWSFDGHFSELFLYYACETRNLAIAEDGWRRGAAVRNRWIVRGRDGVPDVCAVIVKAIEIRDKVGWGPFRQTFRWFLQGMTHEAIPGAVLATFPDAKPGGVTREVWKGAGGGSVTDLTASPRFAGPPDATTVLGRFETPTDEDDNYGDRIRGYVCPAATGDYTFWLASDDGGELWLSPDEDPAHRERIAWVAGWTGPRQVEAASQQSRVIHLEAGKRYYVETLHAEGGGGDHLSVAWSSDTRERVPDERLQSLGTEWGKFRLYFDKLAEFSGYDVWSHFTDEELQILQRAYSPRPPEPTQRPADVPADVKTIALSDTKWDAAKVGWLKPARDSTGDDMPLRSGERMYLKGLYAHAPSRYAFTLGRAWRRLTSIYGLQRGNNGTVIFVVVGDGRELFRSDPVNDLKERTLEVDLSGIDELELIIEDGGNGPNGDWGIWFSPELSR